jgi:exodeoxyribonuclease III
MADLKLISWNVNGLRAIHKKGFLKWLEYESPDILCLQETKAHYEQLPHELQLVDGYSTYYSQPEKKGYSGVALYSKNKPKSVEYGFGVDKFDSEGRLIRADYGDFILYNIYFPNGGQGNVRVSYKLEFYDVFLEKIEAERKKGRSIIFCGDVNTAHKEKDLSRPKENAKNTGFLPQERAWLDQVVSLGYIDTFRLFESEGGHYSWWDYYTRARERNVGWRLDYFFTSQNLKTKIKKAYLLPDVMGSDHCPAALELKN